MKISGETPKYLKIREYLIKGIHDRTFTGLIPSENHLADLFSVSRMTARKAVTRMEHDGYVVRVPGKGTYVRKRSHYTEGFFRVRPLRKWAEDIHATLRSEVLDVSVIDEPPAEAADRLGYLGRGIHLRRMNYFDDRPVRHDDYFLREDRCAGIIREDFGKVSVQEVLESKYRLPLTKITQTMEAIPLDGEMAALFDEKPGYPAFHFKRTSFSYDEPICYVEYIMRGDMAFRDTFIPLIDGPDLMSGE